MWPNPQEIADLVTLLKKSWIENFIFVLRLFELTCIYCIYCLETIDCDKLR